MTLKSTTRFITAPFRYIALNAYCMGLAIILMAEEIVWHYRRPTKGA